MRSTTADPVQRVITAPAVLGLSTREEFRLAANDLIDELPEGQGQLVVDLGATRDVDSSGLGTLVLLQRRAAERRVGILLRAVGPELEYLLVLTKLDDLFAFEKSPQRA